MSLYSWISNPRCHSQGDDEKLGLAWHCSPPKLSCPIIQRIHDIMHPKGRHSYAEPIQNWSIFSPHWIRPSPWHTNQNATNLLLHFTKNQGPQFREARTRRKWFSIAPGQSIKWQVFGSNFDYKMGRKSTKPSGAEHWGPSRKKAQWLSIRELLKKYVNSELNKPHWASPCKVFCM